MKDVLQRFPELDEIQTFSEYNHIQYVVYVTMNSPTQGYLTESYDILSSHWRMDHFRSDIKGVRFKRFGGESTDHFTI
jgi:hypothetical protein